MSWGGSSKYQGLDYSPVVGCVLSVHKAHGSIPSTTFKKKKKLFLRDGNMTHRGNGLFYAQ